MEEDYYDKPTQRKGGKSKDGDQPDLPEAFVNEDLVEDFCRQYEPGDPGQFDPYFTRSQLRKMFGCGQYGIDPYPEYIGILKGLGYKERITPDGPGIYYREVEFKDAEEWEDE